LLNIQVLFVDDFPGFEVIDLLIPVDQATHDEITGGQNHHTFGTAGISANEWCEV
jgi:hypothetical protein